MSTFKKTLTLNILSHCLSTSCPIYNVGQTTSRSVPYKNKILSNKASTQTRLACNPTKISDIDKGIGNNSSDLKKAVLI